AAPKTPREMVGELPDFAFRNAQHFGRLREGAPRLKSREPTYYRAMVAAVFLEDELHHVVLEVVREINVNVREFIQRHPFLVEEAAKIEVKTNRADAADAKAIADQTVGCAPACNPLDAPPPAVLEKIPGDEEILLVANPVNDAKFLHHLRADLTRPRPVTLVQTLKNKASQELARTWGGREESGERRAESSLRPPVLPSSLFPLPSSLFHPGRPERRKLRFAEGQLKVASLGDFACVAQPVWMFLAGSRHFCRRAEMPRLSVRRGGAFFRMLLPQQSQCADALQDVVLLA